MLVDPGRESLPPGVVVAVEVVEAAAVVAVVLGWQLQV
jgi:hypothetical protein